MNTNGFADDSADSPMGVDIDTTGQRLLPRLTRRVFVDLAIWMIGFGVIMGLVFPFFVVGMGVPSAEVLNPLFFAATLCAGIVVGTTNHILSRAVVGSRVRLLAARMAKVEDNVRLSMYSGDPSACTPEACSIPVDSEDELGDAAAGFNRLVDALATSTQVNDVARRFAATLSSHIDLNRLAEHALRDLQAIGPFEAGAICAMQDDVLTTIASHGLVDRDSLVASAPVIQVLRGLDVVRLELPEDLAIDAGLLVFRPRTVIVLPLHLRLVPVGVVVLASAREISDDEQRLVEQLLPNLAVALNNALGHERLQRVAAIDPLTGLYNRRFGLERLSEDFSRAVRSGEPLGLLLFDIDHFKATNDTFGHQAGDRLLQAVAQSAKAVLREGDTVMRYGGEEFLVVLPGAGAVDVEDLGQRVRRAVESTEIGVGSTTLSATVSVGAVAFPSTDVNDIDDLVRLPDTAMYAAKAAGRNRLSLAT